LHRGRRCLLAGPQKLLPRVTSKEELVGVAIEEKSQPRVYPGLAKKFEIFKRRHKIKGRKQSERFVEFFGTAAVEAIKAWLNQVSCEPSMRQVG